LGPINGANWLDELISTAISQRLPLRHVRVLWSPGPYYQKPEPEVWPWERLERIKEAAGNAGLVLSYPPPTMTRGEFELLPGGGKRAIQKSPRI